MAGKIAKARGAGAGFAGFREWDHLWTLLAYIKELRQLSALSRRDEHLMQINDSRTEKNQTRCMPAAR